MSEQQTYLQHNTSGWTSPKWGFVVLGGIVVILASAAWTYHNYVTRQGVAKTVVLLGGGDNGFVATVGDTTISASTIYTRDNPHAGAEIDRVHGKSREKLAAELGAVGRPPGYRTSQAPWLAPRCVTLE